MHAPLSEAITPKLRTRRLLAPGIFVIDNFMDEASHKRIFEAIAKRHWMHGWKSNGRTDTLTFWHQHVGGYNRKSQKPYECSADLKKSSPVLHQFWQYLSRPGHFFHGHTLWRCYVNAQQYGSDGTIHRDSKRDDAFTAIYYPCLKWEPNWAGETVIFDNEQTDVIAACFPKPNRLLVFPGKAPHIARGVSRTCPELRITLIYKTLVGGLDERTDRKSPEIPDRPSSDQPHPP